MLISIAKDFSDTPWGRYPSDGDVCGQNFRERFLVGAFADSKVPEVVVNIDGVEGLGSSFLDEAFGSLVRKSKISEEALKKKLRVETSQPELRMYIDLIWRYIAQAQAEINRELIKA